MKRKMLVLLAIMAVTCWAGTARAYTITVTTPVGAMSGGLPVDASATIVTSAGTVTVTLTNLEANPTSIHQCINGVFFILSGTPGTASLSSSSGVELTVAAGGTWTSGSTVSTGWGVVNASPIFGLTTTGPTHTIIGPDNGSGLYSNADNTIAGNILNNPFLANTATFNLDISSVTVDTTVSLVLFSFPTQVPMPPSALLMGSGLLGLGGWRRFRKS